MYSGLSAKSVPAKRSGYACREEFALLVLAPVHRIRHQFRADAAVVQQRIAFGRRAISGHSLALLTGGFKELQQTALGALTCSENPVDDGIFFEPCTVFLFANSARHDP